MVRLVNQDVGETLSGVEDSGVSNFHIVANWVSSIHAVLVASGQARIYNLEWSTIQSGRVEVKCQHELTLVLTIPLVQLRRAPITGQ
jgi:hypothetical protein